MKTKNLNPFEDKLQAVLHPVQPSRQYVQTLRQRIHFKAPVEIAQDITPPPTLLFVLGGVLSVSLLILTAVRAIFYLTNRTKI